MPDRLMPNPAGASPEKLYGGVPPVALNVNAEYAVPTLPPGNGLALVMASAALTVIVNVAVALCSLDGSVALTSKLKVPTAVGVPEITPLPESILKPGTGPIDQNNCASAVADNCAE